MTRTPIGGKELVTATPASGDIMTFYDVSDGGKPRRTTMAAIGALGPIASVQVVATDTVVLRDASNSDALIYDTVTEVITAGINGATIAEINAVADVSARIVTVANGTNTLTLDPTLHSGKLVLVLDATMAITLPEATGTGNIYKVVQGIAATSSTFVTADTANCGFHGFIMGSDTDAATNYNWVATGTQDTITFNGVATGGKLYDWVEFTDIATDAWMLRGMIRQSGGSEATPLSSAA